MECVIRYSMSCLELLAYTFFMSFGGLGTKGLCTTCRQRLANFEAEHIRMLEEKSGQEEAVQAASAKLLAIEEFNEQLDGKVISSVKPI